MVIAARCLIRHPDRRRGAGANGTGAAPRKPAAGPARSGSRCSTTSPSGGCRFPTRCRRSPTRLDLDGLEAGARGLSPRRHRRGRHGPRRRSPTRPRARSPSGSRSAATPHDRLRAHRRLPARGSELAGRRPRSAAGPRRRSCSSRKPTAVVRAFFATQRPIDIGRQVRACPRLPGRRARPRRRRAHPRDLAQGRVRQGVRGEDPREVPRRARRRPITASAWSGMLFKENWGAAQRAAARAGADYASLVKARIGASDNAKKTGALLDAVPAALRSDTSYAFSRAQWLRRNNKPAEAANAIAERHRATRRSSPTATSGGPSAASSPASSSTTATSATAYEVVSRHGAEAAQHASRPSSTPAGSRCASSTSRRSRRRISRAAARGSPRRRSRSPASPIGRAAPPRRSGPRRWRSATTSAPPTIRSPITASSRAQSSATALVAARCARSRRGRPRLPSRDSRRRRRCGCSTASARPTSRSR